MNKIFVILSLLVAFAVSAYAAEGIDSLANISLSNKSRSHAVVPLSISPDSLQLSAVEPETTAKKYSKTAWVKQLVKNGFKLNDTTINYPKFPRFCVNVYNWADRTFNSYDTAYVVSTGKKWKLTLKNYDWISDYSFVYSNHKTINIGTQHINTDIGISLAFMAVSLGYTFNANKLLQGTNDNRSRFNFSFTCALLRVEYTYIYSKGNGVIHRFGDYNGGKRISVPFDNLNNKTHQASAMYYFNHRKYSQAAVNCFSKYQLKSAGTWLAGLNFESKDAFFNFETLPPDMIPYLPGGQFQYRFQYFDILGMGGYAYSWVPRPRKWLINGQILGGLGYKRTGADNLDGKQNLFATKAGASVSAVFNHRALFIGATFDAGFSFYFNKDLSFIDSRYSLDFVIGCRF
ncbi:MAG: DUF4421 domain-containing protein [Muribaculaceae bacterium]|nr:DUF4421 domain-containing protein [Muribaculaceae bacterium]